MTGVWLARAAGLLPLGLVIVAEAAWISVVAGLLQEFAHREPGLAIPVLAACVVAGVLAARLAGRRLGRQWPAVGVTLVLLAAVVGVLAAPAARAAMPAGPGAVIAANPGGLMAGLAVFRGFAHVRLPLAEGTVATLLGLGVPGIATLAIVGGVIVDPFRARFLADTLAAAIVFTGSAILALTLTRVESLGRVARFDWRRNPTWLGLAIGVLAIAIAVAVPLSAVAGQALGALFAIAVGPLLLVGLTTGLDRTGRRILGLAAAVVVVIFVASRFVDPARREAPGGASTGIADQRPTAADDLITVGIAGLALGITVLALLVLTALWMRRTHPPMDDPVEETRAIDRSGDGRSARPARRRLGRRAEPVTAAEAYVALIADLERHPVARRDDGETPAEHAARMRAEGRPELRLDLLAADYALTRYGGRALSAREDRRAVGRWRLLRTQLIRRPPAR